MRITFEYMYALYTNASAFMDARVGKYLYNVMKMGIPVT